MAGDNQHFIPLHVLRGFAIAGDPKFGWVYRAGTPPEPQRLKKLASDYQFYSEPGPDSLDEKITAHENDELAPSVAALRANPPGAVDGQRAAKIVAHLSVRTESTRESLVSGVRTMASRMASVFGNESAIRNYIGLDGKEAGQRFNDRVVAELRKNPSLRRAEIPDEVLTRVAFGIAREQFSTSHRQFAPALRFKLTTLYQSANEFVRQSHIKALNAGIVPEERANALAELTWDVVEIPYNIVLPDCVAIGIGQDGNARPLLLADNAQLRAVAMALNSRRLLLGHRVGAPRFDPTTFNIHAIACSERFFVSAIASPELSDWSRFIGIQSSALVNRELASAFEEFVSAPEPELPLEPTLPPDEAVPLPSFTYHFLGCADEPTAKRIMAVISGVTQDLSAIIPLNRLDGVTFAEDYSAALSSLDRGFATELVLSTTSEPEAVGVAMAPLVLREGVVKVHIVMRGWLGHALISEDEAAREAAAQILVGQLAEVGCIELFDTALPGVLLAPFSSYFDNLRYTQVADAWSGYFAARVSAPISPNAGEGYRTLLVAALRRASEELPRLRLDYRFHCDVSRFVEASMKQVGYILRHSARLIGHNDGVDDETQEDIALAGELERLGLKAWFDLYAQDLRALWNQRGKWSSFEEFVALGYHAERLLWPYGIFLWPTLDGGYGLSAPLHTDAVRLPKEIIRRPFQTMRLIGRAFRRRFGRRNSPPLAPKVPPAT